MYRASRCLLLACLAAAIAARAEPPEQWGRDRHVDIEEVVLDLEVDPEAGRVAGRARLEVHGLADGVDVVELDAVDFDVRGVRVDGRPVDWTEDGLTLFVPLGRSLEHGESVPYEERLDA